MADPKLELGCLWLNFVTPYRLAKDAKFSHQRVNEIVNEKRGIMAETDLQLCAFFGQEPGYWLRVQLAYDLREAVNTVGIKIKVMVACVIEGSPAFSMTDRFRRVLQLPN